MTDLTNLKSALRLREEPLEDLTASDLPDTVFPTRPAYYVRVEGDKREPAEPSPQFAAQFMLKLSRGDEHLRDHFIRANQEYKLKLFPIYTVGSFPMGYYNISVAKFRSGLERERTLLQREIAEVTASACGASGSPPARQVLTPGPVRKMTKAEWVQNGWPDKLKAARGSRTQKEAAQECGVSVETYKKWEQGARAPRSSNLEAVSRFVGLKQ